MLDHEPTLLILDAGSQYTQLIARRVREAGVYAVILPIDVGAATAQACQPQAVILSGSHHSVYADQSLAWPDWLDDFSGPILGICYGMHLMALRHGGRVHHGTHHEFGATAIHLVPHLMWGPWNTPQHTVWMSHGDHVSTLPPGFVRLANSQNTPVVAMAHEERPWYAVQFHPEVTHTHDHVAWINHWVHQIAGMERSWTPDHMVERIHQAVSEQVGPDEEVVLGLSGGVDSSVVAALLAPVLGKRLHCVMVDSGLLRDQEVMCVQQSMPHVAIDVVDAQDRFMNDLKGVADPEEKRKRIGKRFIEIFESRVAERYPKARWLAQGTIYPDVIESAASAHGKATVIKSHHNVGGLPEHMTLKLLEPLRELFKDEVRQVGRALGLPSALVDRHPFPGPGLAIRIMGPVTEEAVRVVRQADALFLDTLKKHGWFDRVSQAFAVFTPVRSVGVTGDARRYAYVLALRAVESIDFMTAQSAPLPHELLQEASARITNAIPEVARVVYDVCSKPPATIEWE